MTEKTPATDKFPATDGIKDTRLPVTVEKETVEYRGFRKLESIDYREDESGLSARRELVTGKHAVAVVILDPELDRLVLIRQFRLGAQIGTGYGMAVELVAGLIDEGEDPVDCARREMMEETGLTADTITPLCSFLTTPGMTSETIHLYYAETDAGNLPSQAGLSGETEQTFPFLASFEEAMVAVDGNDIHNGITMLGLMWFARHRAKLTGKNP